MTGGRFGLAVLVLAGLAQGADVPARLAGSWQVTQFVIGPGFGGGTFPSAGSPPHVVARNGNTVTFTEDVQVAYAQFGMPPRDSMAFTLTCASRAACALTAVSKTWLHLAGFPLTASGDSLLAGAGTMSVGGDTLPLTVTIAFASPRGHKWTIRAMGRDGRPLRELEMTFKPAGAP